MKNWEKELYNKLTEKDKWGNNNHLKETLFGDDEWSGVRMSEAIDHLKTNIEENNWGWG